QYVVLVLIITQIHRWYRMSIAMGNRAASK
ncbi:carboxymuconolactone decarboxylase family protein, partial [Bacillus subtilis]|nr:carboxymuconolactone decarboxylase family protein [Bacillus subtilis]